MARVAANELMKGVSGAVGNMLVFKTMRGKTYVTTKASKPDKTKETAAQRSTRVTFKQAAEWAQLTLLNPEKKLYYQQRAKALKLPNAYTAAITDYMRKPRVVKVAGRKTVSYAVSKPGFAIANVSVRVANAAGESIPQPKLTTRRQNNTWVVYYTPDAGVAASLTLMITDSTLRDVRYADVPV